MRQSFFRHFPYTYKKLLESIQEKERRKAIHKELLKGTVLDEMLIKSQASIVKLEKEIQEIKHSDLYLNFALQDITYLKNEFDLTSQEYDTVDKQIQLIINIMHISIIKINTSEENKQLDQHNNTSNSLAKRKFIANYPSNSFEYTKALKSRSSIKLLEKNNRNANILDKLNSKFNDKELLTAYTACETLAAQIHTATDIKKDIKFLVQQKLNKFFNKTQLIDIQELINEEVLLLITHAPLTNKDQLQALIEQLELLESKYYKQELKKLVDKNLTGEEVWENII